jgi:hypothetical protein
LLAARAGDADRSRLAVTTRLTRQPYWSKQSWRSDGADRPLLAAFTGQAALTVPSGFAGQALRPDRPDLAAVAAVAGQSALAVGAIAAGLAVLDVVKSRADFSGELML